MSLSKELIQKLDQVMNARSVALLGATDSPERVGYQLLESLIAGKYGGNLYPVHPRHKELLGLKVYPSLAEIPETVDLALIALNQQKTVEAVRECGQRGVKGAVCVAGGFKEVGAEGKALEKELAAAAGETDLMVIGPNTLGFFNSDINLNATFYPEQPPKGNGISVISQSGGVGRAIIEVLRDEGLGMNKWVGAGNRTVLEFSDYVDYLAEDKATRVIVLFIEGTEKGRELMDACGRAAKRKPVLIYRAGNSELAKQSAVTHTGSMISSPKLFSDACKQFGVIEAGSVPELVSKAKALSLCPPFKGERIGIMTHTAGPSITLLDGLAAADCRLAEFTPQTMVRLQEMFHGVPVILKNPLDAAAFGYSPEGYGQVAEMVMADPNVDILVVMHALHKNWKFAAREMVKLKDKYKKPVVACYISTQVGAEENRQILQPAGIPCFSSTETAAWGIAGCIEAMRVNHGR